MFNFRTSQAVRKYFNKYESGNKNYIMYMYVYIYYISGAAYEHNTCIIPYIYSVHVHVCNTLYTCILFFTLRLMGWWCHNRETRFEMTNGEIVFSSLTLLYNCYNYMYTCIHVCMYMYIHVHEHNISMARFCSNNA